MFISVLLCLCAAPAALAPLDAPTAAASFALRVSKVYLGDGQAVEDCVVIVEDGRIRDLGRGVHVPDGMPLLERSGCLSAGLIACGSYDTLRATTDTTRALLPEGRVADAFDADHADLGRALAAGITSLLLVPRPENVIGGVSAVVHTSGGRVLAEEAQLSLSLVSQALAYNREPTSYGHALALLDDLFARPEGALAKAKSGQLPVIIEAIERHEVARALDFAQKLGLKGTLLGARLAGEQAEMVKQSGFGVLVGPFELGAPMRELRSVSALVEAGVPVAFALRAPEHAADSLRSSAALCMRAGLPAAAALRALTSDAARLAGVAKQVGRLERGLVADLVLWSGDPLDLGSAVEAVWVDGRLALSASPAAQQHGAKQ